MEAHSSLNPSKNKKKIQCAVNPNHPVLVTAGDDMTLRIWNLESNKLIYKSFLGFEISALSYTPDGTYLTWGQMNGVFYVVDGKLGRKEDYEGNELEDFTIPSLNEKM